MNQKYVCPLVSCTKNKKAESKLWFQCIQEYIQDNYKCTESEYYNRVFTENFRYYRPEIPLWLPRWSGDVKGEPSATILNLN